MRESIPSRPAGGLLAGVFAVLSSLIVFLHPTPAMAAPRFVATFSPTNQVKGLSNPCQVAVTESHLFILDNATIDVRSRTYPYPRVARYGTMGTNEGFFFKNPKGMALNGAGDRIAIADTGNNRIQLFSVKGGQLVFQKAFGYTSPTNDPLRDGTFRAPNAVSFTPSGDLLVSDTGNGRVQHFDSEGVHLATYSIVEGSSSILGISADESDAGYWVAIKGGVENRVARYDYDATTSGLSIGIRFGLFSDVKALAGGYLAVSDSIGRKAMILDPNAAEEIIACEIGAQKSSGGTEAELRQPTGIFAKADEKMIFIADTGKKRVVWYEISGYVPPVEPPPVEPPEEIYPEGTGSVAEAALARTTTSHLATSVANVTAQEKIVTDVAVAPDYLFALVRHGPDGNKPIPDHIDVYHRSQPGSMAGHYTGFRDDSTGNLVSLSSSQSLALNGDGTVLAVADTYHDRIVLLKVAGPVLSFGETISTFSLFASSASEGKTISRTFSKPSAVAFTPGGDLLVADRGNSRVLRFMAGDYRSADSYAVGKDGLAVLEDVCYDCVEGQEGFWIIDSRKAAPPYAAFYPFGFSSPSIISPSIFDHPSAICAWNDGVTNRLAVVDYSASSLLLFQLVPERPEMRLCTVLGSSYTTNSFPGPHGASGRLWKNENLWDRALVNGQEVFSPSPIMNDTAFPKLQNPRGLAIGVENGTNVFYVADNGHSRICWYGVTLDGVENGGAPPDPPVPPVIKEVAWPISSISIEEGGAGTLPSRTVVIGWCFPPNILERNGYYRLDHAGKLGGPWAPIAKVLIVNPPPAGASVPLPEVRIDFSDPKLNPDYNFFTLWWVGDGVVNP